MKRFPTILLIAAFCFACSTEQGSGEAEKETEPAHQVSTEEPAVETRAQNPSKTATAPADEDPQELTERCRKFLADYEGWSGQFLEAAAAMLESPNDAATKARYEAVASQINKWTGSWDDLQDCPDHPEFKARFDAIGRMMEAELRKLNAE